MFRDLIRETLDDEEQEISRLDNAKKQIDDLYQGNPNLFELNKSDRSAISNFSPLISQEGGVNAVEQESEVKRRSQINYDPNSEIDFERLVDKLSKVTYIKLKRLYTDHFINSPLFFQLINELQNTIVESRFLRQA